MDDGTAAESQEVNNWSSWLFAQQVLPGILERGRGASEHQLTVGGAASGSAVPAPAPGSRRLGVRLHQAMLDRWTVSLAVETHRQGIRSTRCRRSAAATAHARRQRVVSQVYFEPLDTMAEAAPARRDDPNRSPAGSLSLDLLVELDHPVYDLRGNELVEGWQPADIPGIIAAQDAESVKRDAEAEAKSTAR
jgi:hypothetical protein